MTTTPPEAAALAERLSALHEAATPAPWFTSGPPWFQASSSLLYGNPDPHAGCPLGDFETWTGEREEHVDNHEGCRLGDPDSDAALTALLRNSAPAIIAALRENEKLREALRPFAKFSSGYGRHARDDSWVLIESTTGERRITMGDVRLAEDVLKVSP